MPGKKHLATISILIEDRQTNANKMQQILTNHGHLIMARMGVNLQPACIAHCTGLISVAVKGSVKEINDLTRKLNRLYGIVAKNNIMSNNI